MSPEITELHEQQQGQVLSPVEKNISNIKVSDLVVEEQPATDDDKAPVIIPRITVATTTEDYIKYCVPKVVSIGPYHYGNPNLMPIQNLKLDIAKDLFSSEEKNEQLGVLHVKLSERAMLQKLRGYYDEISFTDTEFTNMMLLDACFIIYYINIRIINERWKITMFRTRIKLPTHQMISICQDLFLLENQIPFQVLELVWTHLRKKLPNQQMETGHNSVTNILDPAIKEFIIRGYNFSLGDSWERDHVDVNLESGYLLQHLHLMLTSNYKKEERCSGCEETLQHPLPRAKELMDAGIHFRPSNNLFQIHFYRHRFWRISATVKLYPLVVHGSTKLLFLNLLAYEASSSNISIHKQLPIISSYIWLLSSLIGQPEDVKALQDAGVIEDSQGSGSTVDDVKTFIKDIAADLYRVNSAFKETQSHIHQHYHRFKRFSKPISQFKHKYFNSPWSFLALVGAIMALLLTAVQTYFTAWSPKDECDDLCKFLKIHHHL